MLFDFLQFEEFFDGLDGLFVDVGDFLIFVGFMFLVFVVCVLVECLSVWIEGCVWFVDCFVFGGEDGVVFGIFLIMFGGVLDDVVIVVEVFVLCGMFVLLGLLGVGEVVKVCNQFVVFVMILVLGEVIVLVECFGFDFDVLWLLFFCGYVGLNLFDSCCDRFVSGDDFLSGVVQYMVKDF